MKGRDRGVELTAADIPFGLAPLPVAPPDPPARSIGELLVRLIRSLAASRREVASYRELLHRSLDVLAEVIADRDRLRARYHSLLDERRVAKAVR